MSIANMALAAMNAGLRGEKMPLLGSKLSIEVLEMVNSIYDEARNYRAGKMVRSRG
jgi:hypothetical protein